MKKIYLTSSNYLLFLFITLILLAVQSTLWLQIFGNTPSPIFWIPTLVFWQTQRSQFHAIAMTYLISIILSALVSIPLGILITINTIFYIVCRYFRNRIHSNGQLPFMFLTGFISLLFPIIYILISKIFEPKPASQFDIFYWIMEGLLTMLAGMLVFNFFVKIDTLTKNIFKLEKI